MILSIYSSISIIDTEGKNSKLRFKIDKFQVVNEIN